MMHREKYIYYLLEPLQAEKLTVVNDSHLHRGHTGDDGSGESHFTIILTVASLNGLKRVEKHARVMALLKPAFENGLHAVRIIFENPPP